MAGTWANVCTAQTTWRNVKSPRVDKGFGADFSLPALPGQAFTQQAAETRSTRLLARFKFTLRARAHNSRIYGLCCSAVPVPSGL